MVKNFVNDNGKTANVEECEVLDCRRNLACKSSPNSLSISRDCLFQSTICILFCAPYTQTAIFESADSDEYFEFNTKLN